MLSFEKQSLSFLQAFAASSVYKMLVAALADTQWLTHESTNRLHLFHLSKVKAS